MKSEDEQMYRPIKSPMTDMEFRNYLDSDGHMVKPEEFRLSIYQGGIEPSLRRVVWRHLLNIYPKDMSGRERFDYMKKKEKEYFELRDRWRHLFTTRQVSEEVKHVASLVKKDVLRTDRGHKYYSGGDESKNLVALYNLLVTYALTHPEVSYCQGMSDIASPLLVVQKEEAQAYLCFCGLMKRLRSNFMYDGEAITTKLQHLSTLVQFYDPVFNAYMKSHGAEDLFFCYRWLLLEMKREFPFDDALYMLEVMWSTIPPNPPEGQLDICDMEYSPALLMSVSPNSPSYGLKTQYSHLLAKRRMSTVHVKESSDKKDAKVSSSVDKKLDSVEESKCESVVDSGSEDVESPESEENNCDTSSSEETVPASKQNGSISSEKEGSDSSCQTTKNCKETKDESGKESSNTETDEGVANSSIGSSNSSSYLSASQSIERFPSLITASIEDKTSYDSEAEVISLGESKTLTETGTVLENKVNGVKNSNQSMDRQEVDFVGNNCVTKTADENEDQSQFHLSLEETDWQIDKKKNNIPQIKGSFFSGMKRILSSPKKRPGQAQRFVGNTQVQKHDLKTDTLAESDNAEIKGVLKLSPKNGDEHTLFEVNRMIKSLNSIPKEAVDPDSGTGSLTSSTNSLHVLGIKNRSASQGSDMEQKNLRKPVEVLSQDQKDFFDRKYKETVCDIPKTKKDLGTLCSDNTPSFCVDHFDIQGEETARTDESKDANGISDCIEATDPDEVKLDRFKQLPSPDQFGYGNPFLMFLCLTVLLQHRDVIMKSGMEYDELAMYFDKMVRKHNVNKVLHQTRIMYTEYIRMQQKLLEGEDDEEDFNV